MNPVSYIGYYINLDRDADRRAAMEAQLTALGPEARYRRFPAVDGNPFGVATSTLTDGELGCFLSHYLLLQMHLDGAAHLHVIEDDTILASRAPYFLRQAIASGQLENLDILFTESAITLSLDAWWEGRREYQSRINRTEDGAVADVRFGHVPYVAGTTSYLVNRGSIQLVCDILREELEGRATRPIDLLIREKATEGKLRVQCLFPFITSTGLADSTSTMSRDDVTLRSRFALDLLRRSFFVECDPRALFEQADQQLPRPDMDFRARLHQCLAAFIDSDLYRHF
jgi:GR25 family glycosyltransferase involved in LPS biosynthesis